MRLLKELILVKPNAYNNAQAIKLAFFFKGSPTFALFLLFLLSHKCIDPGCLYIEED